MPPEEMTGSTHILEFMCYANSRFRRDKIPHGNGDVIQMLALSAGGFAVAVVRSPPKFVVSLVVLRRTTERV